MEKAMILIGFTLILTGCSGKTTPPEHTGPDTQPHTLTRFNQSLGQTHSEPTIREAIDQFITRANGTITIIQDTQSNTNYSTKNTNREISLQEACQNFTPFLTQSHRQSRQSNNEGIDSFSEEAPQLISPEELAKIINTIDTRSGYPKTTPDQIISTTLSIRKNLTNLSNRSDTLMSPFEASIVMYYMYTGDNGTHHSLDLTASNTQIQKFLTLLQEAAQ